MKNFDVYESKEYSNFILFTSKIGSDRSLTQGPGGNISMKLNRKILVKKSGSIMSEAIQKDIFVKLNLSRSILLIKLNIWFLKKFKKANTPSIESFFHLLIPDKYVLHLHSVNSVSVAIRKDFFELFEPYTEIKCLTYEKPGVKLAKMVARVKDLSKIKVIVLQNHGLIVFGKTIEELEEKIGYFDLIIQGLYSTMGINESLNSNKLEQLGGFLTPDHVTFAPCFDRELNSDSSDTKFWISDLKWALQKSLNHVPSEDLLNFLSIEDVKELSSWQAEKYRIAKNV
jgi:ribulose-5-phosphate 4-epimerase/fuculose-1-phosphate aldolase